MRKGWTIGTVTGVSVVNTRALSRLRARTLEEIWKMHGLDKMKVTVPKHKVLTALKANREQHQKIVVEARAGYMKAARKALEEEMKKLESGKPVRIGVHLELPADNTKVYDTAIEMFEMHQGETVDLDGGQFRTLIMNKWDWMDMFLHQNSGYSHTASTMAGGGDEGPEA